MARNFRSPDQEGGGSPYLSPRDRVLQQRQMRQFRQQPQRLQVGEFGETVGREHEGGEIGRRGRERGLDAVDAVAREQEGVQARGEREVGQDGDVVVGEVDGVLVLHILDGYSLVQLRGEGGKGWGARLWRHRGSRWRGFCALWSSDHDINGASSPTQV